jgi:hypothetical protein
MIQKRNFDAIYSSFVIGVVKTLFKNLLSLSSVIEDETRGKRKRGRGR